MAVDVVWVLLFCPLNPSYRSDFPSLPLLPIKIFLVIGHYITSHWLTDASDKDRMTMRLVMCFIAFWLKHFTLWPWTSFFTSTTFKCWGYRYRLFCVAHSIAFCHWEWNSEFDTYKESFQLLSCTLSPKCLHFHVFPFPKNHCIDFCLVLTFVQGLNHILK